jgi:hypothetical protein
MASAVAYPLIFGIFTGLVSEKFAYLPTALIMGAVTIFCYVFVAHDVKKYLNDDAIEVKKGGGRPKDLNFHLKKLECY